MLSADHPDVVRISDPGRTKRLLGFKLSIAAQLLSAKADVNARSPQDETPLSVAVRWNQLSAVKLLLEAKAEVHTSSKTFEGWREGEWRLFGGMTPLHYACDSGNTAIADALVDAKADPRVKNAQDEYPAQLTIGTVEDWESYHAALLERFNRP